MDSLSDNSKSDIEEFLRHSEDDVDSTDVGGYLRDKTVLVTGAGGSIGSELCRQIIRCQPGHLLLLGRGEHSIYQIRNELKFLAPDQTITSIIGDVCHPGKIDFVFRTYRPEIVFHAAAHKHVIFVEQNPEEGVNNNIFGTQNIARIARQYQIEKFVLISTDKAVYATSVLGATKKLAELLIQELAAEGSTEFVNVRFGNVLRSRGSAVPFFEKQIDNGGPLTLSHPDVERYFMSIHEAVHLVLQSGATGKNGDLCILDMGEQIRILDLVETLIRMKGLTPYEEIDIIFSGLESGEKLSEQMLTKEEAGSAKKIGKILICRSEECNGRIREKQMDRLRQAADQCRREEIIQLLQKMVPGYRPSGLQNA
jgi:FlaA1/EpsC-like NDP-sugar epimerase